MRNEIGKSELDHNFIVLHLLLLLLLLPFSFIYCMKNRVILNKKKKYREKVEKSQLISIRNTKFKSYSQLDFRK